MLVEGLWGNRVGPLGLTWSDATSGFLSNFFWRPLLRFTGECSVLLDVQLEWESDVSHNPRYFRVTEYEALEDSFDFSILLNSHVMSIDIDWETLTTGPEGLELAESIRDFIHDKFQRVQLPGFIRSVHVHSFDFGKECPVIEIKDICDPLAEFYENDDDSEDDEDALSDRPGHVSEAPQTNNPDASSNGNASDTSAAFKRPNFIDTRIHPQRSPFMLAEQIATPFLSRSNTPGIPGGTSNLSYFHLPLSAGLSGSQTPLANAVGGTTLSTRFDHQNLPKPTPDASLQYPHTQLPTYADPSSRPSTSDSYDHAPSKAPVELGHASKDTLPSPAAPSPTDTQITLHITYAGSVSLSITASLLLDYPMSSFASIPLKLSITGLSFDGVALVAYLRKRAHFCFLGAEDAQVLVGAEHGINGRNNDNKVGEKEQKADKLGGLIREIRVESEIGKREGGKQSLKNVGKVEKFVVEQVRRMFEEEFVWPSWWTFLV